MKKTVLANNINKVTMFGREKAAHTIFQLLGEELLKAYNKNHENVCYDRRGEYHGNALKSDIAADYAEEALERTRPAFEVFDSSPSFQILEQCLDVILRIYCDHDIDDNALSAALLEIKQYQQRARLERVA